MPLISNVTTLGGNRTQALRVLSESANHYTKELLFGVTVCTLGMTLPGIFCLCLEIFGKQYTFLVSWRFWKCCCGVSSKVRFECIFCNVYLLVGMDDGIIEFLFFGRDFIACNPVKVWANSLTPYSLRTHLNHLMVCSIWGHLVSSQWTYKMSLLWVCNSHSELTATTAWWAHPVIPQQAHHVCCKLMESSQWVILWVLSEVTECNQNELSVSLNVSSQSVSYELKFFTGPTLQNLENDLYRLKNSNST